LPAFGAAAIVTGIEKAEVVTPVFWQTVPILGVIERLFGVKLIGVMPAASKFDVVVLPL
jgi:hypothetical protein